jgi:hypothetical protein
MTVKVTWVASERSWVEHETVVEVEDLPAGATDEDWAQAAYAIIMKDHPKAEMISASEITERVLSVERVYAGA